jgi:hypothetical protein
MKGRRCHVILRAYSGSNRPIETGNRRNEDSGRKYQQQEYEEQKQVNAAL